MGKFVSIALIFILGLTLVASGIWLKKVGESKKTGPMMEDIKVCEFVSFNAPCDINVSEIPQDNREIYATVEMNNITNSQLFTKWYYVQGKSRSLIGRSEQTVYSDGVVQLRLEKDMARGWLLGDYAVELELENGNKLAKEFKIVVNE